MQKNGWKGARCRMFLCYLVFVKPILAYMQSWMEAVYGEKFDKTMFNDGLVFGCFICTIIPLLAIKSFEFSLKDLSRMTRTTAKVNLIRVLVPLTQIQQTVISFAFVFYHCYTFNFFLCKLGYFATIGVVPFFVSFFLFLQINDTKVL